MNTFKISLVIMAFIMVSCNEEKQKTIKEKQALKIDTKTINLPFKKDLIPFKKVEVNTMQDTVIYIESGSYIDIPQSAFLDMDGNVIEGSVDFTYRTFDDPVDFFVSGIPMTLNSTSNEINYLKSGGMIEVYAEKDGKTLQPNPESPIEIAIASKQEGKFPLYSFEEGKGWSEIGTTENYDQIKIDSIININIPSPPRNLKKVKTFYYIDEFLANAKPELTKYVGYNFSPLDPKCDLGNEMSHLADIKINDIGNGKYELILTRLGQMHPMYCVCDRVYNDKEYNKKKNEYVVTYSNISKIRNILKKTQTSMREKGNKFLNSFKPLKFGILNCDAFATNKINKYTYEANDYDQVDILLYCVDYTLNTVIACNEIDLIAINPNNDYGMFAIDRDENVLYESRTAAKRSFKNNHFRFRLTKINTKGISIHKLKKLINK